MLTSVKVKTLSDWKLMRTHISRLSAISLALFIPMKGICVSNVVFAGHGDLKDKNDKHLTLVKTEPLITGQGNLATGEQEVNFTLDSTSDYLMLLDDVTVKPGETISIKKNADDTGAIDFNLEPVQSVLGTASYSIDVKNIYSNLDRFWSAIEDECSEWIDTGIDENISVWEPPISNQTANFTQTKKWENVFRRNCRHREKDSNVGEIRYVSDPFEQSKKESEAQTRTVSVSVEMDVISKNCSEWTPAANTVNSGTTFSQNRTCDTSGNNNFKYLVDSRIIASSQKPYKKNINEVRQQTGTKEVAGVWNEYREEMHSPQAIYDRVDALYPDNWDTLPKTDYYGGNKCAVGSDGVVYCDPEMFKVSYDEDGYPFPDPDGEPCPVGAVAAFDDIYEIWVTNNRLQRIMEFVSEECVPK